MNLSGFFDGVSDWNDCCAALAARTELERGTAFEHIVRHYLRTDPAYRAKLADIWFHHEVPAELRTRLNFPSRDEGIDLLARTHTGEFWAIQTKFRRDADATLTHRELATFTSLAFTVCREISFALVCTTTARIPGLLENLPHLGDLTAETWTSLGAEFFASLRDSFGTTRPPPLPSPRKPLPHQHRAIAAAHAHYVERSAARGKLISPCGSGKSLTACWIAEQLGARRVLIAVPSLALIRQTLETWMREALATGRAADWLCVCSDPEVTDTDSAELLAHVHELGLPCDTSPAAVSAHLRAAQDRPGQFVVLATYQSSPVVAAAARDAGFTFDFAVLDEAHKTTGRTQGVFAHLLHDENLPLPRRLFMTATERRFQGSSDDIVSMDDPALYGETFELLTFRDAIAATPPILSDYRILTIGVRESDVARLVEQNRWLDLGVNGLDEVTATALASLIALRRATREHGVRHTVSFHSSIARAKQFRDLCARLNAAIATEPAIAPHHVNGAMGSAARQRELECFLAAEPSLVTNARCLTEGVDLPSIDCVFFADPKGSTIEIVQAAGRALRLAEGKKLGYILLPLVVPDGATLDDVAASSAFKFVLFVLRALATHDDRIVEWFRATAEGRASEVGGLVQFDFGDVATPLGVSAEEFAKQIEVRCWASVGRLAYQSYSNAVAFAREHNLKSQSQWRSKIAFLGEFWPANIPRTPDKSYVGRGWTTWGDFFGTGTVSTKTKTFRPFEEAREWARTLGLETSEEWYLFCRGKFPHLGNRPYDVPHVPPKSYRGKGWTNWTDFLGADWLPFDQARAFARSLKFTGQRAWKQYCRGERPDLPPKPEDIPASPWYAYQDRGWAGWRDWLGTEKPAREKPVSATPAKPRAPRKSRPSKFRDFASARSFAHSLKLKSSTEWYAYVQGRRPDLGPKPVDIPSSPHGAYEDDWQGWGDWLGTGNVAPFRRVFRPFAEARTFARTLNLRTGDDWDRWGRIRGNRPPDIPSSPEIVYRNQGWISYADFLQTSD